MSEQVPADPFPEGSDLDEGSPNGPIQPDRVRTGVPSIDRVLDDVDGLDGAPLEEHLAVFERAHHGLRAALDEAPSDASDDPA